VRLRSRHAPKASVFTSKPGRPQKKAMNNTTVQIVAYILQRSREIMQKIISINPATYIKVGGFSQSFCFLKLWFFRCLLG